MTRRDRRRFRPVPDPELLEHVPDVGLDGGLAHAEPLGDLPVPQAVGEQRQHLPLAVAQHRERVVRRRGHRRAAVAQERRGAAPVGAQAGEVLGGEVAVMRRRAVALARVGDRLVRMRYESSQNSSGMGQKGNEQVVATLRVH